MSEAWYKEYCPKCKTHNWVCNGDETDLSGIDVEGIKCRECGHIWFLDDEEIWEDIKEFTDIEKVEDCFWKLGLETPN